LEIEMRAPLPFHRFRALWVAGLVLGCTSPTDAALGSLTGTYVLQSVDGAAVPVLQVGYTTFRQYLVTDTVVADGRGHYSRVRITEKVSTVGDYRDITRGAWTGTYTIRGDTVDFPYTCPMGAMCLAAPVGWRTADGSLVIADRRTTGFMFVSRFLRVQ
jgi:hypothetical protein